MRRVFANEDGDILAVHDQGQSVPADAYPGTREFIVPDDMTIDPIEVNSDRGNRRMTRGRLPDDFMRDYKPPLAKTISRRQGRLALLGAGLLDAVETYIATMSDPFQKAAAQISYEADTWTYDDPTMKTLAGALGVTPTQFDDLWRTAQGIA